MKYAQAQKEVLTQLFKNPKEVINVITPDYRVALAPNSGMGYVFPDDVNWIDLERIEKTVSLTALHLPLRTQENRLEPTKHLRDCSGDIVREYKKAWLDGQAASCYIAEKCLKNFDFVTLYQDITNPKGIIAITENLPVEGEVLVGFVMPFKIKEE